MAFTDRFEVQLRLRRLGKTISVPAGNIRHIGLGLKRSGFAGEVEFVLRDDSLLAGSFVDELAPVVLTPEQLDVELSLQPRHPAPEAGAVPQVVRVMGVAMERALREEATDWSVDEPLLWRRYVVEFADPARVHWEQHFPCELYTEATLLDVVKSQCTASIDVQSTWAVALEQHPQIFLNLPAQERASFLDWLGWYLQRAGGGLVYDYETGAYALAPDDSSTASEQALFGDDLEVVEFRLPRQRHHQPRIRNCFALEPETLNVQVKDVISPLVDDYLVRSSAPALPTELSNREQVRHTQRQNRVDVRFARFPTVCGMPGALLACRKGQRFGQGSLLLANSWRVDSVRLDAWATSAELDAEHGSPSVGLKMELATTLRKSTDLQSVEGDFSVPQYPAYVEGLVLSEIGASADKTWDQVSDQETAGEQVRVKLPMFEQDVAIPFEPTFDSSGTYRPCHRNERILVALGVHDAWHVRTLSWREEAALPRDGQGEQMVFGKNPESITKVSHVYDSEQPVFTVLRRNGDDHINMTMSEGKLVIGVEEQSG